MKHVYSGDVGEHLTQAALGQDFLAKAAVAFVWSAVPSRTETKYHRRAGRYIYLEVGHIAENLYLAAGALGLGCCAIGAFDDEQVNQVLRVDGVRETSIYMCAVGPR